MLTLAPRFQVARPSAQTRRGWLASFRMVGVVFHQPGNEQDEKVTRDRTRLIEHRSRTVGRVQHPLEDSRPRGVVGPAISGVSRPASG